MKQLIVLLIVIFSISVSAQNWTSVKETNVWVGNAPNFGVDIYTNGYGNHIIVQRPNVLKYFKMNVNGTATDSVVIENSSVITPSITGDKEKIYIVYRKTNENFIRIKYLSNGDTSVQSLSNLNIGSANWIESVMSNNRLHVTYEVSNTIYYSYYVFETSSWSAQLRVSTGENGIIPRITAWHDNNDDKVYFMYKRQSSSDIKWREYNVTAGSWTGNPQLAISYVESMPAGFAVDDTRISFYYQFFSTPYWYFQWIVKYKSNNSTFCTFDPPDINNTSYYLNSTTTYDGNVHVPLWLNFAGNDEYYRGIYRVNGYDCNWELIYWNNFQQEPNVNFINGSSASNDVYVIWQDAYIGQNLRLIYDDKDPLAPQNLTVTKSKNNHPYLKWDSNNEPDLNQYYIYKFILDWQLIGSTSNTYYEDEDEEYCTAPPPQQCINEHNIAYRITAVDIQSHESGPSNVVIARVVGGAPAKLGGNNLGTSKIIVYSLKQNYPNPFNPTTQISYSLAQDAFVTLKVYDMIGNEVAELVNGGQTTGFHEINYDASGLSSGIYIYRVTAMNGERILFSESKQMILLR